ncbi:MAG: hypothetical protein BLITH_1563 [Brockia lithotrophica]|uniref:Macro domain-containing protein n=1 Tax=Brockia lithotrophica TaxID=933949 RepID=A0A2T5G5M7_9BACL|nr:[protein ADP-ribosylglutamate] hydrolase [Brockia lithotrophica]PTQ51486.1 MAG: hypothetical protein BLITH_1563 [Brockia lithotrophica]
MLTYPYRLGRVELLLVEGDITKISADAIVNAANPEVEHGGGVAFAIGKAAAGCAKEYTKISQEELRRRYGEGRLAPGKVLVTPPMRLAEHGVRAVIHTVGPVCRGAWNEGHARALYAAFAAPLEEAERQGFTSIAYPAVSAGIYGCPLERVVETFAAVVRDAAHRLVSVGSVSLVLRERDKVELAREILDRQRA